MAHRVANGEEHGLHTIKNIARAKRQNLPRVKNCLKSFIAKEGNYAEWADIVHPLRRQLFAGNASKRHECGTCRMDVSSKWTSLKCHIWKKKQSENLRLAPRSRFKVA